MNESITLRDKVTLPRTTVAHMLGHADSRYTPAWFETLPAMVDRWCERWDITLHPDIPSLSYTVVLFGRSATEGEVVLKLAPAGMEFSSEIAGLAAFQGPDLVRLIHADPAEAGLLMERVVPGTPLRAFDDRIDDATATAIGAAMLRRLWRPAPADPGDLIPLERWFRDLFRLRNQLRDGRDDVPVSRDAVERGARLAERLLASGDTSALHGDLHHGNILARADGGWTVIDPKGLIGDRAYDIGTWMLNGWPAAEQGDHASILRRRIDDFARELGMPRERVIGGALVHAVLVIAWACVDTTPEDRAHDTWLEGTLRVHAILDAMATTSDLGH